MSGGRARIPVLQLAPWVDFGGTDKGTIDWFRWLDRERFALSLLTTQPSPNRRLADVVPYAEEVWALPDLMSGDAIARFVLDFIASRGVRVVHVMNSRLGYELLPDIHALPDRPRVVVQVHVEEPERNGYVRYVATRFGNLVDAFSVSTPGLAGSLVEYGVTRDRIQVILTGIDAEEEFSPEHVVPLDGLEPDVANILFAARLVAQKDPLLMLEVVDALREREPGFVMHVVGEGELEPALRAAIAERGLERWFRLHPSSPDLPRWYAACDALLMTSEFEGVPYIVYEVMAMGLPLVAPALPGIQALVAPGTAHLIDPRDDVAGYVSALAGLVADRGAAAEMGARARRHMRARFPIRAMADGHAALYEELLASADAAPDAGPAPAVALARPAPAPVRFRTRPSRGQPLVSAVVPCFNQGTWLLECVESLRAQTYPELEVIVVDDASTDPDTVAALSELEFGGRARVLRQQRNAGPSAARNRGIRAARGRYVLPVDSDNLLLPRAVERLVAQLQGAGERVGYVYQNLQYFGNREDYFEAPDHNLRVLMGGNYCDSSALIDSDVFKAGLWFPADVVDGHEDWDFFLTLAEHDIVGEPARAKTLMARKHGFTRSDRIDHVVGISEPALAARHPTLFAQADGALKARWSPALSLVALEPLRSGSLSALRFAARAPAQTCLDFEVLTVADRELELAPAPAVRWLPLRPGSAPVDVLEEGLRRARGRWILVTRAAAGEALANRALVEQLLRLFLAGDDLRAVAFADAGGHDLRPLSETEADGKAIHALAWAVPDEPRGLSGASLAPGEELAALAGRFALAGEQVEWRQLADPSRPSRAPAGRPRRLLLDDPSDGHARRERELRLACGPALRSAPPLTRLRPDDSWRPVHTLHLCRHREHRGEGRILNTSMDPVPGYEREWILGLVRSQSWVGTVRLVLDPGGGIEVRPRGEPLDAAELARTLGYAEEVHFNGLEPLLCGRHTKTGQVLLACGSDDPLLAQLAEPVEAVGYIERAPINPQDRAHGRSLPRVLGLVRAADFEARRHRYAVGGVPEGRCVWELGAVLGEPVEGARPLRVVDERVVADGGPPGPRPAPGRALKWALSPLGWSELGQSSARRRAVLRRLASAPGHVLNPARAPTAAGEPVGWLLGEGGPGRIALYAAVHPVTGDQLLTTHRVEAGETGYGEPTLLGYLLARAPQTGTLTRPPTAIPWASRFGEAVRWHHDPGEMP